MEISKQFQSNEQMVPMYIKDISREIITKITNFLNDMQNCINNIVNKIRKSHNQILDNYIDNADDDMIIFTLGINKMITLAKVKLAVFYHELINKIKSSQEISIAMGFEAILSKNDSPHFPFIKFSQNDFMILKSTSSAPDLTILDDTINFERERSLSLPCYSYDFNITSKKTSKQNSKYASDVNNDDDQTNNSIPFKSYKNSNFLPGEYDDNFGHAFNLNFVLNKQKNIFKKKRNVTKLEMFLHKIAPLSKLTKLTNINIKNCILFVVFYHVFRSKTNK